VKPIGALTHEERRARFVALVGEIFDLLYLSAAQPATTPRYATARANPLDSERGFRAACASGAFPTFKLGRQIAARWEDVERYAESRARPVPPEAPEAVVDPDRAELEAAGVCFPPASGTARRRRGGQR
jgi:hypothetical protein